MYLIEIVLKSAFELLNAGQPSKNHRMWMPRLSQDCVFNQFR